MNQFFKKHIKQRRTPRKQECEEFKKRHEQLFADKEWDKIKIYVYNTFRVQ